LPHLRRWKRSGQRFAIEWNGEAVQSVDKAFANVVADAGLGDDVTLARIAAHGSDVAIVRLTLASKEAL
jgi:hypothetical protein